MNAPKRWLDDAGAGGAERDLLRAGLSMEPPPGAEGAVWAALLGKLPPPGAPPAGDGGASAAKAAGTAKSAAAAKGAAVAKGASAAAAGGIVKSALIGAGSAVALIATYSVVTPSTPDPAPPVAASVAPIQETPRSVPSSTLPLPAASATATTSASAATSAAPAPKVAADPRPVASGAASAASATADPEVSRETLLREESRMVGEARDALRRGDAAGALVMLDKIVSRFPGGMLVQEREALAIEALARSGRCDEAKQRAYVFVDRWPASPFTARVQAFTQ